MGKEGLCFALLGVGMTVAVRKRGGKKKNDKKQYNNNKKRQNRPAEYGVAGICFLSSL